MMIMKGFYFISSLLYIPEVLLQVLTLYHQTFCKTCSLSPCKVSYCTARLCPRNVTTACVLSSHLPSFYLIFVNVLIQQQKGAGRLPTAYILEQFLKEGNGGNLRQKSGQSFERYDLFTPAIRSRMQLFYF